MSKKKDVNKTVSSLNNRFKEINQKNTIPKNKKQTSPKSEKKVTSSSSSQRKTTTKPKPQKRKKMTPIRLIRIIIRWIIFFILLVVAIGGLWKGASAMMDILKGKNNQQAATTEDTASEATTEEAVAKVHQAVSITISAIGDCTLGVDASSGYQGEFINTYQSENDPSYFFKNVKSILEQDDLTIANLEGTLTNVEQPAVQQYAFKGKPEYAKILSAGSVDAVSLANSHTSDFGEQGYKDTVEFTEQAGVKTFGSDSNAIVNVKGINVGLVGMNITEENTSSYEQFLKDSIANVKQKGAQLVIVSLHWGIEKENYPTDTQVTLGHAAIDGGADLVLGHHPHVLQGIEEYNGKNIVYSLGNFCYGANPYPSDMDTMIYQQTFTVTGTEVANDLVTNIIPCKISSVTDVNNYQPTPAEGDDRQLITERITTYSQGILSGIRAKGSSVSSESTETTGSESASSESTETTGSESASSESTETTDSENASSESSEVIE